MVACPLTSYSADQRVPKMVSLVGRKCDHATNALKVVHFEHDNPKGARRRGNIAVCVKHLSFYYSDPSRAKRVVEWLELVRILGADQVFLYLANLNEAMRNVTDYYQAKGLVSVANLTHPGFVPNLPAHENFEHLHWDHTELERICINDCLYRNMDRYKYLAVLDLDEVMVPRDHPDWGQMLDSLEKEKNGSSTGFEFQPVFFFDEDMTDNETVWLSDESDSPVPSYMHMLRHYPRSNYSGHGSKSIIKTDRVLSMFNHWPLRSRCDTKLCKTDDIHVGPAPQAADRAAQRRFGHRLIRRTERALRDLRML